MADASPTTILPSAALIPTMAAIENILEHFLNKFIYAENFTD